MKHALAAGILLPLILLGCLQQPRQSPGPSASGEDAYHIHADFKIVLNGNIVDFNKAAYMSTAYKELDPYVHLHDFNPYVLHFHSDKATLGEFFRSVGMDFNSACFFDGNTSYCTNGTSTLQFYVNTAENQQFGEYKPTDLDKLLIYYGGNRPSQETFNSLTSWACVYSKKCPVPAGVNVEEESCTATKPCSINDAP